MTQKKQNELEQFRDYLREQEKSSHTILTSRNFSTQM